MFIPSVGMPPQDGILQLLQPKCELVDKGILYVTGGTEFIFEQDGDILYLIEKNTSVKWYFQYLADDGNWHSVYSSPTAYNARAFPLVKDKTKIYCPSTYNATAYLLYQVYKCGYKYGDIKYVQVQNSITIDVDADAIVLSSDQAYNEATINIEDKSITFPISFDPEYGVPVAFIESPGTITITCGGNCPQSLIYFFVWRE